MLPKSVAIVLSGPVGHKLSTLWVALAVLALSPMASQAALIAGSEGFVTLTGNDSAYSSGSFVVNVAYEVYDGTSASDPMGITSDMQITFVLQHCGSDGEDPALAFSRFYVYAPGDPAPFYTNKYAVNPSSSGQFLIGPVGNEIDPYGGVAPHRDLGTAMSITSSPNRARFSFQTTMLDVADFQPDQYSQLLVLTANPAYFTTPQDIIIEIDGTATSPSISADTIITIVPEPASSMCAALSGAFWLLRRRRGFGLKS